MKVLALALLFIIGTVTGNWHGSSHQRPPQYPNYANYNNQPAQTNNIASATLSASPSNTVLVGAPVTLTCQFTFAIYAKLVYFSIADNVQSPNDLAFDTSSIPAGKPMMVSPNVAVVIYNSAISLVFYTTTFSDSAVYQCYIPGVVTSNQLPLTVTDQLPIAVTVSSHRQDKSTLVAAITVPVVVVLAVLIVILVLRFRYGYRFYGMFQFRRMRQEANLEKAVEVTDGKPEVLDANKLPAYDVAVKASSAKVYLPPDYNYLYE